MVFLISTGDLLMPMQQNLLSLFQAAIILDYMLSILSLQDESIDTIETRDILKSLARPNIHITVYDGYDHAIRRLAENGAPLRWPSHPVDYYPIQMAFIKQALRLQAH